MAPDRKNDILKAAAICFAQYGYEKTTLDDIGEKVGMNKVSLYYYFKNKEAIFKEVVIKEADEYSESLRNKVEEKSGCRNKILAWIEEGCKYSQTSTFLHRISMETLKKLTPEIEELKRYAKDRGVKYLTSLLQDGHKNGEIIDCDIIKVGQVIQDVVYAMKDTAVQRYQTSIQTNLNTKFDFEGMVKDQLFAVSLILDGITIKK